jgi:hypothetical protein
MAPADVFTCDVLRKNGYQIINAFAYVNQPAVFLTVTVFP